MFERLELRLRKAKVALSGQGGQTLAEYAVLLLLIAVACVAAITAFGGAVLNLWNTAVGVFPPLGG